MKPFEPLPYTPEQQDFIAAMWDAGHSDSQIAKAFNARFGEARSRSAIIGWRSRNADRLTRPVKSAPSPASAAHRSSLPSSSQQRQAAPKYRPVSVKALPIDTALDDAPRALSALPVRGLQALARDCQYPVSGSGASLIFCGEPVDPAARNVSSRRSYCRAHGDVVAPASEQRRYRRSPSVKALTHKGAFDG